MMCDEQQRRQRGDRLLPKSVNRIDGRRSTLDVPCTGSREIASGLQACKRNLHQQGEPVKALKLCAVACAQSLACLRKVSWELLAQCSTSTSKVQVKSVEAIRASSSLRHCGACRSMLMLENVSSRVIETAGHGMSCDRASRLVELVVGKARLALLATLTLCSRNDNMRLAINFITVQCDANEVRGQEDSMSTAFASSTVASHSQIHLIRPSSSFASLAMSSLSL